VWTLAEARCFLAYVVGDRLYPLWRLLLRTGLRRGELCGLMWRDLEPDLATLAVRRQRVVEDPTSWVREKPPKSHNGTRSLVLDPVTLTTLTDTRPRATAAVVSGYVFTGRGGRPLRPDNVSGRFNRFAVGAGVRAIGPHQVRHLLASSLLDSGYGIAEVAERLGHDPGTLMRCYSRVNAGRRRRTADHIADLVAPGEAGTPPRHGTRNAGAGMNVSRSDPARWALTPRGGLLECVHVGAAVGRNHATAAALAAGERTLGGLDQRLRQRVRRAPGVDGWTGSRTPLLGWFTLLATCTSMLEHAAGAFNYWGSRGRGFESRRPDRVKGQLGWPFLLTIVDALVGS
jgi:hypothetical protein